MTNHLPPDNFLTHIDRLAAGDLSGVEATEVEAWISGDARLREVRRALQQAILGTEDEATVERRERRLAMVLAQRLLVTRSVWEDPLRGRWGVGRWALGRNFGKQTLRAVPGQAQWWSALAASGVIALLIMSVIYSSIRTRAPSRQRFHTAVGERATVRLPNGTRMVLAPATSVVVTSDRVDVAGDVYFDVAPQASRVFVVRTRQAVVQVLGTRFAVRQYATDADSRVVVEDGKVMLRSRTRRMLGTAPVVVSAHMFAQLSDSGISVTQNVPPADYVGWADGTLVFDRVLLRDIAAELIRTYGVEIRIADTTLANKRMTMEIAVSRHPLTHVLEMIGKVYDAHYSRVGTMYILSRGRAASPLPSSAPPRHLYPQPEKSYGL